MGGTCGLPALGHIGGVVAEDGLAVVVALDESDATAGAEVDGGEQVHEGATVDASGG